MSSVRDFHKTNNNIVDRCDRCHNHFNVLTIHDGKQYCTSCIRVVEKKEAEE